VAKDAEMWHNALQIKLERLAFHTHWDIGAVALAGEEQLCELLRIFGLTWSKFCPLGQDSFVFNKSRQWSVGYFQSDDRLNAGTAGQSCWMRAPILFV
jgi:hypothetical protein